MLLTYTGEFFDPFNPDPKKIHIEDIAHALSNLCRFTGHARTFYSVGEHCIHVSMRVPMRYALAGLLHDASEAYLADVASPVKRHDAMGLYRQAERKLQDEINARFGILPGEVAEVRTADLRMLATEAGVLMPKSNFNWGAEPYDMALTGYNPSEARTAFLNRFAVLV